MKLDQQKTWWDNVIEEETKLGYYVNENKSWLILKNLKDMENAKSIFQNSSIKFTTAGKRHLGAAIGSKIFKRSR